MTHFWEMKLFFFDVQQLSWRAKNFFARRKLLTKTDFKVFYSKQSRHWKFGRRQIFVYFLPSKKKILSEQRISCWVQKLVLLIWVIFQLSEIVIFNAAHWIQNPNFHDFSIHKFCIESALDVEMISSWFHDFVQSFGFARRVRSSRRICLIWPNLSACSLSWDQISKTETLFQLK